jgi:probable HAF family extracellular repeat protein
MGPGQPFLYKDGAEQTLNPFDIPLTALAGTAHGINDSGQIVGAAPTEALGWQHGFLFSPTTPAVDLYPERAEEHFSSQAVAVSPTGLVVGTFTKRGDSNNGQDTEDSFFWDGQGFRYPEDVLGGAGFTPGAINERGQVAGFASKDGQTRAVVYDGVRFTDLPGLPGSSGSRAYGINAHGVVVGTAALADGTSRAVVWRDGVVYDINLLLASAPDLTLQEASAVNDVGQIGQIVAWGATRSGTPRYPQTLIRSFLLTPIANQPPTVELGGPLEVGEGGSLILTATATDPEDGTLTYEWDLGDGYGPPSPDGSATFSAASLDGPDTRTVGVRVTDPGGLEAAATATVNILNVRPTATFAISPSTVYVGEAATVSFTGPSDPGVADTAAGFSYAYDCTSDGSFEVQASTTPSHSCAYTLAGGQSARGRIEDKGGSAAGGAPAVTAPG